MHSGGGKGDDKMAEKRHAITNESPDTLFLNYRDPFLGTGPWVETTVSRVRAKLPWKNRILLPGFQRPGEYERGNGIFG